MNIILDKLPETIEVNGNEYPIRQDFRAWIRFTQILFSGESEENAVINAMNTVLTEFPPDITATLQAVLDFYICGKRKNGASGQSKNATNCIDFDYDAQYIFSAFWQQYGIDLQTVQMHWWNFRALFDGLTDQTQIVKIMQYRSINLSDIKDKGQREFYLSMKKLYAIPMPDEVQKRNDDISNILANGVDLTAYFESQV